MVVKTKDQENDVKCSKAGGLPLKVLNSLALFPRKGNCRLFIYLRNVECFKGEVSRKIGRKGQTANCAMSFSLPILSWTIVLDKRELTGREIAQSHDF